MSSMSYVGYCRQCGNLCCAVVDDFDHAKDVGQAVNKWIRDGLRIAHVESEVVRREFKGCECQRDKKGRLVGKGSFKQESMF